MKLSKKAVSALIIGNALEWYDFVIYSLMTVYILQAFFPNQSPVNGLLAATATFGVAFLMRPLGAIAFGLYADKIGRKAAITAIMFCMFIAMLMIAFAPTPAQAGIMAPIIIVAARLLQGFSAGGEFGPSTAMLVELAPTEQRCFYASWQMVGQNCASLLGSIAGLLLNYFLSAAQIQTWGWRLPFLAGLLIAPVGIYLRLHVNELRPREDISRPRQHFIDFLLQYRKQLLIGMGLGVGGTAATYLKLYMPVFMHHYLHLSISNSFIGLLAGVLPIIVCVPLFGWLADKIGIRKILISSIALYLLSIYPLFFMLIHHPSVITLIGAELLFGVLLGAYFGVYPAVLASLFPAEIRSTGIAISSNVVVMLFGGFAQFIVTWLINATNNLFAITYYLIFAISISLIAAFYYRDSSYFRIQSDSSAISAVIS